MKRYIILTVVLVAATAFVTVKYFKSLNTFGTHAGNVMRAIPDSAALVLAFNNEKGFYDIFTDKSLLGSLAGDRNMNDLETVRKVLLDHPMIQPLFNGSNVYISLHPSAGDEAQLLLTTSLSKGADATVFETLSKQKNPGFVLTPLTIAEKRGWTAYMPALSKRFYIINTADNIYAASFSKALITRAAVHKAKEKSQFVLLSDQQNANSLANLYVNYEVLSPFFDQLFRNKNNDIFKNFRLLPALAALDLNYKSDALMFNGYTQLQSDKPASYLNLFTRQAAVDNRLKDIYPSTLAYSMTMSASDPLRFTADLADFHARAGLKSERDSLFKRIKAETGISLREEFDKLLGNEFSVVTTRYREKFGLVAVKDGSRLRPFMVNISTMLNDDTGELNYNKLPYFLLGDAFNVFRRPYFRILDNYLVFANSVKELDSYANTYFDRKFISKSERYDRFDQLLAEKSNVCFTINFRNAQQLLRNDLKEPYFKMFDSDKMSLKNYYAASYQLTSADHNFYTNFCMMLNGPDSTVSRKLVKNQ